MGEIIKNTHTFVLPHDSLITFTTLFKYDSWNRMKKITYPDGEQVSYHYNNGGLLKSMSGTKYGQTYHYIDTLRYDKFEKRLFMQYGNSTKTTYTYDNTTQRLSHLVARAMNDSTLMDKRFVYDNADNITSITDSASHHVVGNDTLGGPSDYHFVYDSHL